MVVFKDGGKNWIPFQIVVATSLSPVYATLKSWNHATETSGFNDFSFPTWVTPAKDLNLQLVLDLTV
jgi:hypothetical protein